MELTRPVLAEWKDEMKGGRLSDERKLSEVRLDGELTPRRSDNFCLA